MDSAKQSEDAVKQHKKFASGKATCIDCHTGVAHKEPEEPKPPTKAADASAQARDEGANGASLRP
jgi:cytochrome c-type protein NapC